jgi:hypothetical protein
VLGSECGWWDLVENGSTVEHLRSRTFRIRLVGLLENRMNDVPCGSNARFMPPGKGDIPPIPCFRSAIDPLYEFQGRASTQNIGPAEE